MGVAGAIAGIVFGIYMVFATVLTGVAYVVRKFAVAVINKAADIADAWSGIKESIGKAFIDGVNIAIKSINWLIEKLNSIPGLNLNWSTLSEQQYGAFEPTIGSSSGSKIREYAAGLNDSTDNMLDNLADTGKWGADWIGKLMLGDYEWMRAIDSNWGNLFETGYAWGDAGAGYLDKLKGLWPLDTQVPSEDFLFGAGGADSGDGDGNGGGGGATGAIAKDTNDIKALLERLRDLAERDAVAKFTSVAVNIDMENDIGTTDLDGVITYVNDKVSGAMNNSLAGVL